MNVEKKKSKKRFAASFEPPHRPVVLYLDRNLGKHVIAETLRAAGHSVEIHDDHLPINAPDEDGIALVARKGWLAITKDKNIRYRFAEIETIKESRAKVLVVRAKNATGREIADLFINAMSTIQKFAQTVAAPFVCGVDRSGRITRYEV
ncbi:MAG: DUF5615 family PIN-like protein [Pseudomonadota bacterium]